MATKVDSSERTLSARKVMADAVAAADAVGVSKVSAWVLWFAAQAVETGARKVNPPAALVEHHEHGQRLKPWAAARARAVHVHNHAIPEAIAQHVYDPEAVMAAADEQARAFRHLQALDRALRAWTRTGPKPAGVSLSSWALVAYSCNTLTVTGNAPDGVGAAVVGDLARQWDRWLAENLSYHPDRAEIRTEMVALVRRRVGL